MEDRMRRSLALLVLALVLTGSADRASAQSKRTKAQKIADAMSAAPRSISAKATIMDWPATEGGKMEPLRAGTNGWTCLPDFPGTKGDDPMCVDDQWMSFMSAMMTKAAPQVAREGIGYMIAPGGGYGSNTDPYATKAAPDNEWGYDPPHVMLLVPDKTALEGLPTKRASGGPWVMWSGTPYAHIMVPLGSAKK
jgi:hypothetical protein